MKVVLKDQVREYLKDRGQKELTLDLEEISANCCVGRLPDVRLHGNPPENPDKYRNFTVQGIDVHISRALRTQDTLTFYLTGFGPFKKLDVAGLNLIL